MSIDGIGKGGGPKPSGIASDAPGARGISKGSESSEPFRISKGVVEGAVTQSSLERVRSGEIRLPNTSIRRSTRPRRISEES